VVGTMVAARSRCWAVGVMGPRGRRRIGTGPPAAGLNNFCEGGSIAPLRGFAARH
jgi:hypothetical protein